MPLVSYADSDEEAGEKSPVKVTHLSRGVKRKNTFEDEQGAKAHKLPPALPSVFRTLYATNVRNSTADDPTLHGGRSRQISHTPGNWPSFIFLEWLPDDEAFECLCTIINSEAVHAPFVDDVEARVQTALRSDAGVRQPLHISLSSPLTLHTDQKEIFEKRLQSEITALKVRPFTVSLDAIRWVSNFDGTRTFLIATILKRDLGPLRMLLSTCNSVAKHFELPTLYSEPEESDSKVGVQTKLSGDSRVERIESKNAVDKFHFSIGWTLTKVVSDNVKLSAELQQRLQDIVVKLDSVLLKIGNKVTAVALDG